MSCSSNDGGALHPALTPRLAAALGASLALHAYLIVAFDALPRGMRWGELGIVEPGGAHTLRVALRPLAAEAAPPPVPAAPEMAPPTAQPRAASPEASTGTAREPAFSPLPAARYYTTRELDVRPGILVRVEPEYPEAAARRFLSGRVVARLLIDESGAVEKVLIVSAEPPGYFEASAQQAFFAARFTPGMKDGRPVRVQMLLEISFDSPPPPRPTRVDS